MKAHRIVETVFMKNGLETPAPVCLAQVHRASKEARDIVLAQSTDGNDGRSEWVWVRLPNGDLILGVFPQGDTYLAVEADAQYPAAPTS